ncbi:isopentenyl-diphosphate Delta-isomerase [Ruania halotolerans]|uniref:isopentenyl-diphosphate Delta-isomerase n=1 Tax=Ruania halotolerans TaxID=2897773 RepID=UPI001E31B9CA|nr:isopentenyl-diphosphate Delta-isomerase [Ruania halotolerans]UFU06870.1 isopentenyl-diphosphate Delta-isomerase [Ruania halotolerans]
METGDHVVLLDEDGHASGTALRRDVHHETTPLHLAFSCYAFDAEGRVLLTRRALTKRAWPGVWTNSWCGHPRPGEDFHRAVQRRGAEELGVTVGPVHEVLGDFRYRAVDDSGVVENEYCPVYATRLDVDPVPHPDEVMAWRWVPWSDALALARHAPWAVSPWMAAQAPLLAAQRTAGLAWAT